MIRRNIAANVVGGGTAAVTAFLLIPLQIRQLGVEAYGLIGFLASVQVLFSLFDLGLSPAVTWFVARSGQQAPVTAGIVLRRVAPVYAGIGIGLGLAFVIGAPWLATGWLRLGAVRTEDAVAVIRLAGVALTLRWPVSLLAGSLAGLQQFGPLNLAKGVHALVNFAGALAALLIWHDVVVFAAWLVVSASIELVLYLVGVGVSIRGAPVANAQIPLGSVWRYAGTLALVSALSLVLTQSDRVALARFVETATLGAYVVAYNLLFGLSLIQVVVASAMYPSFASDFASSNLGRIRDRHHDAAQAIIYLYALPFSLLMFFGQSVLELFLAPDAARSTAPVIALLATGFLFNALAAVPFSLSIAGGLSRPVIVVNSGNVAWYLPLLVLSVSVFGPAGAAGVWALLNISYVVTVIPVVHKRLLSGGASRWLRSAFLPFPLVGLVVFGVARLAIGLRGPDDPTLWVAVAASALVYAGVGFRLLSPRLRGHARQLLSRSPWSQPTPLA